MNAYFDNSASTKVSEKAIDIMLKTMREDYANTSAKHIKGVEAEKYIKENFEEVHNILIAQEGSDMISVEPSKYIMKMSSIIKKDKNL